MNLSYEQLLEAQLRFGTSEEDIRKKDDFYMVLSNVVIAPWWEVEMFNNSGLEITKINDKLFNLKNEDVEFSFIQVKQVGAPAIKLGVFANDAISFTILGFVMFMFIKSYNKLKKEEVVVAKAPTTKVCDDCAMEIPIAAKKCAHCGNTAV